MFNQMKHIIYLGLAGIMVFALVACSSNLSVTSTNIPVKTSRISGQIIGPDGVVVGGLVWLSTLSDANCAAMNDKVLNSPELLLSEGEYNEIRDCMSPFASTKTDSEGRYILENVPAGWYHISFQWKQSQPPSMTLDPIPTEAGYYAEEIGRAWRDTQLLEVTVWEESPNDYFMAIVHPSINFSADAELVINFTW